MSITLRKYVNPGASTTSYLPPGHFSHDIALKAERCRRSLYTFTKTFWDIVVPKEFNDNWHIGCVCEHLQAVTEGQISKLLINIPPGSAKCVKKGSLVEMFDGTRKPIEKVKPGDRVISSDGVKILWDEVVAVANSGVKKLLKIVLNDGQEISVTPEHRLYGWDDWVKAGDIRIGDPICVAEHLPSQNGTLSADDAFLIAAWLADGTKNVLSFMVTMTEDVKNLVIKKLKYVSESKGWEYNSTVNETRHTLGGYRKKFGDTPNNFLRQYGLMGMETDTIVIPDEVFRASNETVREFIGTYVACDGTINKKSVSITSNSRRLLDGIKTLLLRFDIKATVRRTWTTCKGKVFFSNKLSISNKESIKRFKENFYVYDKQEKLEILARTLPDKSSTWDIPPVWRKHLSKPPKYIKGFTESENMNKLYYKRDSWSESGIVVRCAEHCCNEALKEKITNGLSWRKVESVEQIEECETFDIQTKTHNAFFVENILSHNSTMACVMWPSWEWIDHSGEQSLFGSFDIELALRDSVKCRQVFDSDRYKEMFQPAWHMARDQNAKGFYTNSVNGNRYTFGLNAGGKMGWRGDKVVIDDPNDTAFRFDTTRKAKAWDIWSSVLSTRTNDPANAKFVIIQQRVAYDDFTGKCKEEGGWEELIIPCDFDPSRRYFTKLGWTDPRTEEGECFFPTRYPPEVLLFLRDKKLGAEGYSAQFNQQPFPAGGSRFNEDDFVYWENKGAGLIELHHRHGRTELLKLDLCWTFVTTDFACTEKKSSDYTVFAIWAVTRNFELLLIDMYRDRITEPKILEKSVAIYEPKGYNGRRHTAFLAEDSGLSKPIIQAIRVKGIPVVEVSLNRMDKLTRSATAALRVAGGQVYFPRETPGFRYPWLEEFKKELAQFPMGEHDDMVDNLSLAAEGVYEVGFTGLREPVGIGVEKKTAHEIMEPRTPNVNLNMGKRFFRGGK